MTDQTSYGKRLTDIAAVRPDEADLTIVASDGAERAVTWRELETRANQIARALEGLGVRPGDVVMLALPTCAEHILVTLATWKLGATVLPLRHDLPQWEMERLLEIADPAVLVSDTHTSDRCPVSSSADLAATSSLPSEPLEDRVSECINLVASSGSTGRPKLIARPARGVVDDQLNRLYIDAEAPTVLATSPLYHVNGFHFAAPSLLQGFHSIVMEKFDAALAVELIERHQVDMTVMVPTMLQRIARLDGLRSERFASLKSLLYGGAKIPEWLVDRWLELVPPEVFIFAYGSSEALGNVQMTAAEWAEHRGATGRAIDVAISIRDAEGDELPPGEVGLIFIKNLTDAPRFSYIGQPTPEPTEDGYTTIGDLGWVDEDGYLYVADRRTDLIVSGGANVFPAEVETALSEHPGVIDQVVVGVPDEEWGHRVHAIVQPADSASPPTVEDLRAHCRERLASYKVPKTYELVERMPRTEAGKLNRRDLAAERAGLAVPGRTTAP
jgi:bile acid-coenzyme A ligase